MKKFLDLCLTALLTAIIIIAVGAGINACSENGLGQYIIKGPIYDAADIESVENVMNPVMSSPIDVVATKVQMNAKLEEDSVFRSLDDNVLTNVATVLLKDNSVVTISDIVTAYKANRNIYDNLPPNTAAVSTNEEKPVASISLVQEGNTKVTEAPPTRVDPTETSTTTKDTTIDGKRAKIITKVEKYE